MERFTDKLYNRIIDNIPLAIAIAALGDIAIIAIFLANI